MLEIFPLVCILYELQASFLLSIEWFNFPTDTNFRQGTGETIEGKDTQPVGQAFGTAVQPLLQTATSGLLSWPRSHSQLPADAHPGR